jgi:acyl-CoA thioesterase II
MSGLIEATALEPDGNGFRVTLDPAWDIWGPAGGYIAAIALRAVRKRAEVGHRPLTLTGQFVRVAKPGAIDVSVEPVKTGMTALYAVTLTQDGKTIFMAQIWTSARAEVSAPVLPVMPDVPPPHHLRGQDEIVAERGIKQIAFWRNVEGRPANFRLYTDPPAATSHQHRWMRFRGWTATEDEFLNAMRYVLLVDIGVWPAHWHRLTESASYVAPSLDIWVHFHGGEPAQDWLLSDADTDVSGNGLISGRVRIWSEAGRAVATGGGQCLVASPKS